MSRRIASLEELRAAVAEVVAYNWNDERADYRDHREDGGAHIFTTLVALDNWLRGTNTTPDRAAFGVEREAERGEPCRDT